MNTAMHERPPKFRSPAKHQATNTTQIGDKRDTTNQVGTTTKRAQTNTAQPEPNRARQSLTQNQNEYTATRIFSLAWCPFIARVDGARQFCLPHEHIDR